ncbi:hypothetical protein TNIN_416431 [Trichonephila inaurata madagascariensis]|uniref:Uncharacterized protein n=1 Tax=Trichonephila inaurata madagascariensis TaxID=2747483 RepID=A0A8X6Y2T8_9ARAC|nr:hypothetical protein TNIN_416431 [Trichonephila inaurata madagascariensis]
MRPKKHPYRNSRSKSQRLRRAKEIIKDLLSKTQNAETQLLGVPGSSSRNEVIEKEKVKKAIVCQRPKKKGFKVISSEEKNSGESKKNE